MKLKELLDEIFKDGPKPINDGSLIFDYCLYGSKNLKPHKQKLLECDEFKGLSDIVFVDLPTFELNGETVVVPTYRTGDNSKFKGVGYILSVSLTPEMYDPIKVHTPVKDGAVITPTTYNYQTLEPSKKIVLEFSPEKAQDKQMVNGETILRQELHDLLDKVLDNPKEYEPEGHRGVMIRGVFDESITTAKVPEEPKYSLVYYLKPEPADEYGNVAMKLEKKLIPNELKEKFMEQFGERSNLLTLTESEIEEFLSQNTKKSNDGLSPYLKEVLGEE